MPSHLHHTKPDAWSTDILPRLPADLDLAARSLGAFQRARAVASPRQLLRGLLCYALDQRSLANLGAWGLLVDVADIAPSSWLDRLRQSARWLRWLAGRLLEAPLRPRWLSQRVRGRVLLVDATTLGLAQGPGDAYRLHIAYDLLAGCFDQLLLSSRAGAEQLHHFSLVAGDLVIADSGYGRAADIAAAQLQGADVLLRVHMPNLPLRQADGRPLELLNWLEQLGNPPGAVSRPVWLAHEGRLLRARLVVQRLPLQQRAAALRRAGERARRKGRALTGRSALLACWLVLVTTLEQRAWCPDEVVRLYRLRWQVEVRIKRLKQLVTTSRLRARTAASGEALVWAQLVGWAIHEPTAQELRAKAGKQGRKQEQGPEWTEEVESWQVSVLVLDTVRVAVRGQWDEERVKECLPRLRRYLVKRQRKERAQQEQAGWEWLSGQSRGVGGSQLKPPNLPEYR